MDVSEILFKFPRGLFHIASFCHKLHYSVKCLRYWQLFALSFVFFTYPFLNVLEFSILHWEGQHQTALVTAVCLH